MVPLENTKLAPFGVCPKLLWTHVWEFVETSLFFNPCLGFCKGPHPPPNHSNAINTIHWYSAMKNKHIFLWKGSSRRNGSWLRMFPIGTPGVRACAKGPENEAFLVARMRTWRGDRKQSMPGILLEEPFQRTSSESKHPNPNAMKEHCLRHTSGSFKWKFLRT